MTDFTKQAQP